MLVAQGAFPVHEPKDGLGSACVDSRHFRRRPLEGGAHRLATLLDALVQQVIDAPWEVLGILDEDIDDSHAVVERYATRLPLRIILRQCSTGVAAALADECAETRGSIILRCDDDLTPGPDFVAKHLDWHRQRTIGDAPLGVISMTRDVFHDTTYARACGRPSNLRSLKAAYGRSPHERWKHWAACNSVPKSACVSVGDFDVGTDFREDSELGLRSARAGVEMVIDPNLEIEHRAPATSAESRAARAFTSGASLRAFEPPRSVTPRSLPKSHLHSPFGCSSCPLNLAGLIRTPQPRVSGTGLTSCSPFFPHQVAAGSSPWL